MHKTGLGYTQATPGGTLILSGSARNLSCSRRYHTQFITHQCSVRRACRQRHPTNSKNCQCIVAMARKMSPPPAHPYLPTPMHIIRGQPPYSSPHRHHKPTLPSPGSTTATRPPKGVGGATPNSHQDHGLVMEAMSTVNKCHNSTTYGCNTNDTRSQRFFGHLKSQIKGPSRVTGAQLYGTLEIQCHLQHLAAQPSVQFSGTRRCNPSQIGIVEPPPPSPPPPNGPDYGSDMEVETPPPYCQ